MTLLDQLLGVGEGAGVRRVGPAVDGSGGARREVGVDEPGLDEDDVDAERVQLAAQRVGKRLHGVLRRVVAPEKRQREATTDAADVDDRSAAARPHAGDEGAGDRHQAEHVGLELGAEVGVAHLRGRTDDAEAGVVDEDVDVADGSGDLAELRAVGDVELVGLDAVLFEQGERFAAAAGRDHGVAGLGQSQRGGASDAGGRPGDEDGLHGDHRNERSFRIQQQKNHNYMKLLNKC
jgi:hypothetical protein